jgi:hypothetical protein
MADHSHCPYEHDHPQPFRATLLPEYAADFPHLTPGVEYELCGACWHKDGQAIVMVPCTPETCPGEVTEART